MNTSILQQYRCYRQRPTVQGLYPIAETLGLLCYPEPQTGTIGDVRFGAINLGLDRELGYPEKTLKDELHWNFSHLGIIAKLRYLDFQEIHVELLFETMARSWLQNLSISDAISRGCETLKIDQSILHTCRPEVFDADESIENVFKSAIERMVNKCFSQLDG